MSTAQGSEVLTLKPVTQALSREEYKPKVQAFLYSHKNDAYLVDPNTNFTKTLLDKMFVSRPKKVLPQIKKKENRLQFYKNVKEEEIASPEQLRKGSISKLSRHVSIAENSTGTGVSPTGSPTASPVLPAKNAGRASQRGSIFDFGFKTKFSQDFLHAMISVEREDKPRKKASMHESQEHIEDEDESRLSEISDAPANKMTGRQRFHSTADNYTEPHAMSDSVRKRNVTVISPGKKSDDLAAIEMRKRNITAADPKPASNGLTVDTLKRSTSKESTPSPTRSPGSEGLKRGNSVAEGSPGSKTNLNDPAADTRKRNVTVMSPSKKTDSDDLTADSRKRNTTVTGSGKK